MQVQVSQIVCNRGDMQDIHRLIRVIGARRRSCRRSFLVSRYRPIWRVTYALIYVCGPYIARECVKVCACVYICIYPYRR